MAKAKTPASPEETQKTNLPATLESETGWGDYQGAKGTEDLDSSDINIPRLKLIQALSPEAKEKIAQEGDLLHNITKQVICPVGEVIEIIPICVVKNYFLWRDRADGGGIMARANRVLTPMGPRFQWDKPNTEFSQRIGGKIQVTWKTGRFIEEDHLDQFGSSIPGDASSNPAATLHYNYIIMVPSQGNMMVAISLAKTAAKKARDLNAIMGLGKAPMWARVLKCATVVERKDDNSWYNWQFQPSRLVEFGSDFAKNLQELHEHLKQRGINVDFSDEERAGGADDADAASRTASGRF